MDTFNNVEICKVKSVIDHLMCGGEVHMKLSGDNEARPYLLKPGTFNLCIRGTSMIGTSSVKPILLSMDISLSHFMQYIIEDMPEEEIFRIQSSNTLTKMKGR